VPRGGGQDVRQAVQQDADQLEGNASFKGRSHGGKFF
jgi:hypothetical protein